MSKVYDSDELRYLSSKIGEAGENLASVSSRTLTRMMTDLLERLHGETADALTEVTEELNGCIKETVGEIGNISVSLRKYAELLEETDRRIAEEIVSK